jgi:hypothetical protein
MPSQRRLSAAGENVEARKKSGFDPKAGAIAKSVEDQWNEEVAPP